MITEETISPRRLRNSKNLSLNVPINSFNVSVNPALSNLPSLPSFSGNSMDLEPLSLQHPSDLLDPSHDKHLPDIPATIPSTPMLPNNNARSTLVIKSSPTLSIFPISGPKRRTSALSISIPQSPGTRRSSVPMAQKTGKNINNPLQNHSNNTPLKSHTFSSLSLTKSCPPPLLYEEDEQDPYPDGPIKVCDPNIYLYSEPSLEQASAFDVVINVAREVRNPFMSNTNHSSTSSTSSSTSSSSSYSSTLNSVSSNCSSDEASLSSSPPSSFDSAPDMYTLGWGFNKDVCSSPSNDSSKPQPLGPSSPEYVYIPWEHNSKLVADLESLTDLISLRSQQGKKILIHCQCGVSRSASLIIAYIMRQNQWDLNRAYSHLKSVSPGISPNMSLIFQLSDWARILKLSYNNSLSPASNVTSPGLSDSYTNSLDKVSILGPGGPELSAAYNASLQ